MAIIRGPRPVDNFAMIHNAAVEDGRMTAKARGVLVYLLSRPPGWSTSADKLARSSAFQREGRDAILTALQELEQFGYLVRTRTRQPDGKWSHDQTVTDIPNTLGMELGTTVGLSVDGSSDDGSAVDGKPVDINKTELNKTESNKTDSLLPSSSPVASTSPADLPRMRNEDHFENFWNAYPKSLYKSKTLSEYKIAYGALLDTGMSRDEIHKTLLEGAKGYARLCKQEGRELRYIKSSDHWLKEQLWDDKYPPAPTKIHPFARSVAE